MKTKIFTASVLLAAALFVFTGCSCPINSGSSSGSSQGKAAAQSMSGGTASAAKGQAAEQDHGMAEYHKISQQEAKARMTKNPQVIIVDVRTLGEYKDGHIPKAIVIPNESIKDQPPQELPDKKAEILVYCRSGHRSSQAAHKLVEMGYTQVYDFGGINTWPYEVVK